MAIDPYATPKSDVSFGENARAPSLWTIGVRWLAIVINIILLVAGGIIFFARISALETYDVVLAMVVCVVGLMTLIGLWDTKMRSWWPRVGIWGNAACGGSLLAIVDTTLLQNTVALVGVMLLSATIGLNILALVMAAKS